MRDRFNNYTVTRPRFKKWVGWFLVVYGFLALITPLTPGGTLFFVGLEILGLRIVFTNRVKHIFRRNTALVPQTQKISAEEAN